MTSHAPSTYQYTPASRFRKSWKMTARLLPLCLAPIAVKLYDRPELIHTLMPVMGICAVGLIILYARFLVIRNRPYALTVDEHGMTSSADHVVVSTIHWKDVSKVSDADPYYIKLFSVTSRPIMIESWMPIYSRVRLHVAEKVPSRKVRYVRFWTRPMTFGRDKGSKSTSERGP